MPVRALLSTHAGDNGVFTHSTAMPVPALLVIMVCPAHLLLVKVSYPLKVLC